MNAQADAIIPDGPLQAADHARAILNILDDFGAEKDRLADTQKAILNILDDASEEKERLEATQKAMLNILDDFDAEKLNVERINEELRRENRERRLTAEALTERSVELSRSNADLEQFAYVASHDLQEPLRMVSSYVQLLERRYKGQLDQDADKYIRYAVEGSRRMQALIGGLLEYSRAGLGESVRSSVELDTITDTALANLRSVLEESGALVEREPLPRVLADAAQLGQVIQNLLANAVKFRRPDAPARIRISSEQLSNEAVVRIADNGIGIEAQYFERIFMIFQRLHTRDEYPGTGIGLSICKKVIERHGGKIWVEATAGGGSTFAFSIPTVKRA
jgi:light-regulated signal transduction histidine kinase (bacteriophytochrome)